MDVNALIARSLGKPCRSATAVSGGDIHQSYQVESTDGHQYFAKVNFQRNAAVLAGEYFSLKQLQQLGITGFPTPICFDEFEDGVVLIMSFHELTTLNTDSAQKLARSLERLHRQSYRAFGWHQDNHIGLTPQQNGWNDSWLTFYRERRLAPQLRLAVDRGLNSELVNRIEWLIGHLSEFIDDKSVIPALLHGDLWGGNVALDQSNKQPLLFDPAPYYGDREADLAMTRLFGGFPNEFYQTYQRLWPLEDGHQARVPIYNLYHALNHFNLFGATYSGLIAECLKTNT